MTDRYLLLASLSLALAVLLGAFGAHGLKGVLDSSGLEVWKTAVQYHFFHSLGLGGVSLLAMLRPEKALAPVLALLVVGLLLFSGSLYLMVLSGWRPLAVLTPFGGLAWVLAWLCLAWRLR